ncbi:multicopper oxidase family protein [Streptomyces inhibens]|uniref:multicopper oxidase family protein n=1 Tax=Streptomyces inhibens TaxID=2293571 RepID=UPI001EE6AFB0|nr:multicopper oxidase domain-containing protein [Streptomyces inhibens]UKY48567.1 multicopper oxidase domain-containing protein [Streptomyces inhibens]
MTSRFSRRTVLGLLAGAGTAMTLGATGYAHLAGQTTGRVLASTTKLPPPFKVPLPIPPVARPTSTDGGRDTYEVVQREAAIEILPGLKTTVWGYDGLFPGPTFVTRSGRPAQVRVHNKLPVPTVTHLHGGVTPPQSDGYPTDLLLPAGCNPALRKGVLDSQRAGHAMHIAPADWNVRESYRTYEYPLNQRATTLWYHDHRMDFSAPQVWRGLAGFFLVHDDEEDALPLPRSERDIPLMLCDRAFDADGAFRYPALDPSCTGTPGVHDAYMGGVLGDVQLVNGAPWPRLEVSNTRYRLRLLNASNARRYRLALEPAPRSGTPFTHIGSDGGLLAAPQQLTTLTMAPAERFDVIVDFSAYPVGSHVTLINTLGQNGMRQVMRFHITRRVKDDSAIPRRLSALDALTPREAVAVRRFDFRRAEGADEQQVWTVNGHPFDTATLLATPRLGTVERWRFSSDFHHPVHVHLAHFQVLSRNGRRPAATDAGWKDTVDVRPYEVVDVLARFDGYRGRYMLHCHNLEHEDMAMMANFQVI